MNERLAADELAVFEIVLHSAREYQFVAGFERIEINPQFSGSGHCFIPDGILSRAVRFINGRILLSYSKSSIKTKIE